MLQNQNTKHHTCFVNIIPFTLHMQILSAFELHLVLFLPVFFLIQLKICVLLMCLAVDHNVLYDYVKLLMQEYIYFVSSFLFDNLGFSTVKANLILSVPQGHTCPTWKKGHNHNVVLCILFRKTKYSRSDKWFLKYVLAKCKK